KAFERTPRRALGDQHVALPIQESASRDDDDRALSALIHVGIQRSSRAVVGVDGDIVLGEIAGPYDACRLAYPDIDGNGDLRVLHIRRAVFLAVARRHLAVLGVENVAEPDGEPVP